MQPPPIAAGESATVPLPAKASNPFDSAQEVWITVSCRLRDDCAWATAGHEVAWSQHRLQSVPSVRLMELPSGDNPLKVDESSADVTITGNDFSVSLSKMTGSIQQWTVAGQSLFLSGFGPMLSVWRAPTDNDAPQDAPEWKRYGLDAMTTQVRSVQVSTKPLPRVEVEAWLAPPVLAWRLEVRTRYIVSESGSIYVTTHLRPIGPAPKTLPRLGLEARLPSGLEHVRWLGRGPGESYADMKASQKVWQCLSYFFDLFT